MTSLIRLEGVGKRYGRGEPVLADVDLDVQAGRVIGVLGSNGSGKSTLLRILAALSRETSGTVVGDPRVGYLPDRFPAGQRMSARAYLRHMARIDGHVDLSVIDPLLDRLALVGGPDAPLRTLSKGNAQKVGLAQAVLAEPDLLILDEPWSGLDVEAHTVLGELVAETKERGASVVFTDHRASVVHAHADDVYRIDDGVLTRVETRVENATRIVLHGLGGDWSSEPGVSHVVAEDGKVVLTVEAGHADAVLLRALNRGFSVREVAPCSP
ncbi:ABC transporter ATP-binding protein [Amycolatopsis sp. WAC 04169]|uniref:ATP-binding cassette domain-containing protein n=1 Tax=Amycolatopsis sp. WAC 04169 TaxID=2203197 RepID=UPI000F781A28|nr:ATP-binding cassette domain-containing protein [Amycolatopsis sp. WAC 04169]RSN36918.1 ABC transporter ATP-binding protein [Amycolatopsis sp. WAC 04169]